MYCFAENFTYAADLKNNTQAALNERKLERLTNRFESTNCNKRESSCNNCSKVQSQLQQQLAEYETKCNNMHQTHDDRWGKAYYIAWGTILHLYR